MLNNLIALDNLDTPIYRIFPFKRIRDVLLKRRLTLVAPDLWDDPFENLIVGCGIRYNRNGKSVQEFLDKMRSPVYAQCWSLLEESDALWRIYSTLDKDNVSGRNLSIDTEGVKVRTTVRKLFESFWQSSPVDPSECCFIGKVQYMPKELAVRNVVNEIAQYRLKAFTGGIGHARSLLFKRLSFSHEREVRLIFVSEDDHYLDGRVMSFDTDPNSIFDEIILDPRLHVEDVRERASELKSLGYEGEVNKSPLYQKDLLLIPLD